MATGFNNENTYSNRLTQINSLGLYDLFDKKFGITTSQGGNKSSISGMLIRYLLFQVKDTWYLWVKNSENMQLLDI